MSDRTTLFDLSFLLTHSFLRIHKLILDDLGVKQIAAVVGGSMGGMLALEYAYFGKDYVRAIVPIATSSRHSAWCISWGEAQRQSIYSDPKYEDGYYPFDDPPTSGLGAARMSALLTYRSRDSFESRFGRNAPDPKKHKKININENSSVPGPNASPPNDHWTIHNDGHTATRPLPQWQPEETFTDPQFSGTTAFAPPASGDTKSESNKLSHYFSAQSYLRYQGQKFMKRYDANCYIAITRKLDTHDVSRRRTDTSSDKPMTAALAQIQQPALVLGIESDGLFTFAEQLELAEGIPDSRLKRIESPEGHDAFLLQFEQVNHYILEFFKEVLPHIMDAPGLGTESLQSHIGAVTKSSTFGEVEVDDITAW